MFFDPGFDAPAALPNVMVITIPALKVINHPGSLIEWSLVLGGNQTFPESVLWSERYPETLLCTDSSDGLGQTINIGNGEEAFGFRVLITGSGGTGFQGFLKGPFRVTTVGQGITDLRFFLF